MTGKPKLKPLSQQSIVITGATSGIGLSTARRAARAGACVFLIARGEKDLKALCEELQGTGRRIAFAVADVADFDALSEAADKCRRLFGGFDTWVNNAGVAIFGTIQDTTLEDQRRLFDTNYWGVVNGSTIAAEHLKGRPGGGAIVNVGSVLSDFSAPVVGIYASSKHAVKGFSNALRIELLREQAPVAVTLVKPSPIDTPYSRHARNLTGQAMHNTQPVYATHVVADTILWCASHPIREITVGGGGRLIASFYSALPGVAEPLLARFAPSLMRDRANPYSPTDDGLYDPTEDGLDEEVHYPMVRQFSTLAEARKHPGITTGVIALFGLGVVAAVLLTQRTGPTRNQQFRTRLDPRGWIDTDALRGRLDDLTDRFRSGGEDVEERSQGLLDRLETLLAAFQTGAGDLADRGREYGEDAGRRTRGFFKKARKDFPTDRLRDGARRSGQYAREHAREGGALLAVATIAAAIGAAALESRKPNSKIRSLF